MSHAQHFLCPGTNFVHNVELLDSTSLGTSQITNKLINYDSQIDHYSNLMGFFLGLQTIMLIETVLDRTGKKTKQKEK